MNFSDFLWVYGKMAQVFFFETSIGLLFLGSMAISFFFAWRTRQLRRPPRPPK